MILEPDSNQMQGYMEARRLVAARLSGMDPLQTARNAGCIYDDTVHAILLRYLGADYRVGCSGCDIKRVSDGAPPSLPAQVLMLHYLLHAGARVNRTPSGRLISFREVRGGGANYWPAFEKRAVKPLLKAFGAHPEALVHAGSALGGAVSAYGDASTVITLFPLLPVTYVLYRGDEEMPGAASILFDDTVNALLPCEDIVLAASFGVYELIRLAGSVNRR